MELFTSGAKGREIAMAGKTAHLFRGDAIEFLQTVRTGAADIVFLDPPFNLGKDYGVRSDVEAADPITYAEYIRTVLEESVRVLATGGALFLYHMPSWALEFAPLLNTALSFRHWIAVSMKNGFVRGQGLYPAHYALLYYTKGLPGRFRRPRLRPQTCRHCGRLVKDYGGYRHIIERKGINLSDVWDDLSPVRHKRTKVRSANQLPLALTDRIVEMAGRKGGVLLDPFMGAGTSLVSGLAAGMTVVGNDLSSANVAITVRRLRDVVAHDT